MSLSSRRERIVNDDVNSRNIIANRPIRTRARLIPRETCSSHFAFGRDISTDVAKCESDYSRPSPEKRYIRCMIEDAHRHPHRTRAQARSPENVISLRRIGRKRTSDQLQYKRSCGKLTFSEYYLEDVVITRRDRQYI